MKKKLLFAVIFFSVLLVLFFFVLYALNSIYIHPADSGDDGFWVPVNYTIKDSRIVLDTYQLTKDTELPIIIEYPYGSVSITDIYYGKDIWTDDGIPVPGVVVKKGDETQRADFGFAIVLDIGRTIRYASFRDIKPDGSYDGKPYEVIDEKEIDSMDSDKEKTKTVIQYRLEVQAVSVEPTDPVFKVDLVSEEVKTGKMKAITVH